VSGWLEFWSRANRIYVNDRHLQAHYARIADDLVALLAERPRPLILLDWGCGSALAAPRLVEVGAEVWLFDRSPHYQAELARRFGGRPGLRLLDEAAYAALPAATVDVVLVNSVVQYLDRATLDALLPLWSRLLRPGGVIVFGDLLPPGDTTLADVRALLAAAWRHGFFTAALANLAVMLFSDYRRLRAGLGLAAYAPEEFRDILERAGLAARFQARNIGFFPHRRTCVAQPAAPKVQ
jgi:SAM-dependent methyltransferase